MDLQPIDGPYFLTNWFLMTLIVPVVLGFIGTFWDELKYFVKKVGSSWKD